MDETMAKSTGRAKLVKKSREERAWTQSQLAEIAGVNLRTIQRVEKDGSASFETQMAIANAFKIDVKDLDPVSGSREKKSPQTKVHLLSRIVTGKHLSDLGIGADLFQCEHDDSNDVRAVNAMKDILGLLKGDVVRLYDADPAERFQVESEMTQEIKGLESYGFYLFGIKRVVSRIAGKQNEELTMCTLYMSHALSPKIIHDRRSTMAIPALLAEVVTG